MELNEKLSAVLEGGRTNPENCFPKSLTLEIVEQGKVDTFLILSIPIIYGNK